MSPPVTVLAICGGVGGAKLALGLYRHLGPARLGVVVNTGDDFAHLGPPVSGSEGGGWGMGVDVGGGGGGGRPGPGGSGCSGWGWRAAGGGGGRVWPLAGVRGSDG